MATIVDLKISFSAMSFDDQYSLIKTVQESRLVPKKSTKARAKKSKKKQSGLSDLLAIVKGMSDVDLQEFLDGKDI